MFKDTQRELQRLDAQLRSEEEPGKAAPEFDEDDDTDALDELLGDGTRAETDGAYVYQNYSNRYGRDVRNFANNYRAANTDHLDTDLDEFSDAVQEPEKENLTGLAFTAMILAGGVIILLALWLAKFF